MQTTTPAGRTTSRDIPRPHRARTLLAAILAALTLSTGVMVVSASPAGAAEVSVNFSGYCRARYGGPGISVSTYHAWTGSWTAVTWRCRQTSLFPNSFMNFASIFKPVRGVTYSVNHQIDVNAVCRWQYGSRSYSRLLGQGWGDWRCVV